MSVEYCFDCGQNVDTDWVTMDEHFARVHECGCGERCCIHESCRACYEAWLERMLA